MLYLSLLIIGMFTTYFVSPLFFSIFTKERSSGRSSVKSILIIAIWMILIYFFTGTIENKDIANRLLHSLGGGVSIVLIEFLVVKDFKIKLNLKEIIVLILLLSTFLGVMNEIIEFILQNSLNIIFSKTSQDTWLDLISNLIGTLIALSLFLLIKFRKTINNLI